MVVVNKRNYPRPSNSSKVAEELPFINISSNFGHPDVSARKAVRAHVMRQYKRKKRESSIRKIQATKITSKFNDSVLGSALGTETDFSNESGAYFLHVEISFDSIWTLLDGRADPFDVLPIPSSKRIFLLLQSNALPIRTSVHADFDQVYRSSCWDNPAWLYMTISFASSRLGRLRGEDDTESVIYLSRSLSAVNQTLEASPNEISDSTIATVACLANMENLNGVSTNATIHMNGLQRMVELKGGLDKLGLKGILKRMVLWSDLLCSARSHTAPRFTLQQIHQAPPLSSFTPSALASYSLQLSKNLEFFAMQHNRSEILNMLRRLHELATFLNFSDLNVLPPDAAYPDRVYMIEHSILTLLATERRPGIASVLFNAGLLYIYTNLRQTPVGGAIRGRLVDRLRSILEASDESIANLFPAEILWTFLIGISAAAETIHETWYMMHIKQLCAINGIQTWDVLINFCTSLPVLENVYMQTCRDIWIREAL